MDHWNILDYPPNNRSTLLEGTKKKLINAEIIITYTLIDEYMSMIICNFYFKKRESDNTYRRLWRDDRFRIFNHYILDEIYFLQKLRIVHAIKEVPKEHRNTMEAINALRNAISHSFFPENRRQYMSHKKVNYGGEDIYTTSGMEKLLNNRRDLVAYLEVRVGNT